VKQLKRRSVHVGEDIEVQTTDDEWHRVHVFSTAYGDASLISLIFDDGDVAHVDPDDINWRRPPQ
jgi:hypothetical protein